MNKAWYPTKKGISMSVQQFLQDILAPLETGPFGSTAQCYYGCNLKGKVLKQTAFFDSLSLEQQCLEASAEGCDTYMALGSFNIISGQDGRRTKSNAYQVKSLWADLDIAKAGCDYQNQTEALQALVNFAKQTSYVPSYIVSSGKGLHIYWAFDHAITARKWVSIAKQFYKLCIDNGLQVDKSRAYDVTSILRMPGTTHQKSGNTVTILKATGKLYDPETMFPDAPEEPEQTAVSPASSPSVAEQCFGFTPAPPSYDGTIIAGACEQVLTMGHQERPNWFNALTVLRRCKNGLDLAKQLSAHCPERFVSYDDVEKTFNSANPDSPARCQTFHDNNPEVCERCKHWQKINSPASLYKLLTSTQAQLAKPVTVDEQAHLTIPNWDAALGRVALDDEHDNSGFTVDDKGITWQSYDPKEDVVTPVLIFRTKLYYLRGEVYIDDAQRPHRLHLFEVERPTGQCDRVAFDCDRDCGAQNVVKWFMNAGLIPATPRCDGKLMNMLINAYLAKVEKDPRERTSYDKLGWQEITDPMTREKHKGFVTGSGAVTGSGLQAVAFGGLAKATVPTMCGHKGTVENWLHIPRMYKTLDQKAGQLAMCFSFAAPLMELGGGDAGNCMLSIWSDKTGCGKSQLLKSCASVWGKPNDMFFSKDESIVARCRRLALLNNLPACMDEVTDLPDEDLSNLAFVVASGKEKNKLRSSGAEFIKTGRWSTCTYFTANKSIKECLARYHADTSATLQRVMEYKCDFKQYDDPQVRTYIQTCAKLYNENYGVAGVEFLMKLMKHPERLISLRESVTTWAIQNGFAQEERFMSNPLALALKAGRWAVEFGLLDYDMDALEKWVMDVFVPHNRTATNSSEADWVSTFGDALQDFGLNTLVVRGAQRKKEEPDPLTEAIPDKYILVRPRREVKARYEKDDQVLYVSKKAFNSWCVENKSSPSTVLEALRSEGIYISTTKLNLGKNVSTLPSARITVLRLDADVLRAIGYIAPESRG